MISAFDSGGIKVASHRASVQPPANTDDPMLYDLPDQERGGRRRHGGAAAAWRCGDRGRQDRRDRVRTPFRQFGQNPARGCNGSGSLPLLATPMDVAGSLRGQPRRGLARPNAPRRARPAPNCHSRPRGRADRRCRRNCAYRAWRWSCRDVSRPPAGRPMALARRRCRVQEHSGRSARSRRRSVARHMR